MAWDGHVEPAHRAPQKIRRKIATELVVVSVPRMESLLAQPLVLAGTSTAVPVPGKKRLTSNTRWFLKPGS